MELQKLMDEKLDEEIDHCLRIADDDHANWRSWYRQMSAELAKVYQQEQGRRQTERYIRVLEELTDVIRRKKLVTGKQIKKG